MFPMMVLVSKYIYLALVLIFAGIGFYIYLRKPPGSTCRELYAYQTGIVVLFNLISLILIFLHEWDGALSLDLMKTVGIYVGEMVIMYCLLLTVHKHTNRFLWNCVYMLLSVSFIMLWRLDPETASMQVVWIGICFIVSNLVLFVFRGRWIWKIPSFFFLLVSAGLIVLPFIFPSEAGGSLNWADIHGFVFQPSEIVKLTFAFFLAVIYTHRRRLVSVLQAGVLTGFLALVLLVQNDLGALLLFGILAWMMTYDYLGKAVVLWGGVLAVLAAAVVAYRFVGHVQVRFDIWMDPWADVNGSGYQIAQSLFAIIGGGWFGAGLYQGSPGYIPARTTDMIISAVTEEFGIVLAGALILIYLLMFLFVMETGRRENNAFRRNLLIAFGILFMSQTFIIVGGAIKLIPLTGVTLPFISYGGSSLLSNFITISIIEAVIRLYRMDREEARAHEQQKAARREAAAGYAAEEAEWEYEDGSPYYGKVYDKPPKKQSSGRQKAKDGLQPFEFDDPF